MKLLTVCALLLTAAVWAQAPSAAPAKPAAQGPDAVVARVDGKPVTAAEVTAILGAAQPGALKDAKTIVEQLGLMRALATLAEKAKLDQQSPAKEAIELFRIQTLANAQVGAKMDSFTVTIDEQKKFYQANPDKYTQAKVKILFISFRASPPPQTDPSAKKILTEAEAKAKVEKLLADIRGGADFVKVVKENSDDKESVAHDGDFGTPLTRSGNLPENIRTAVFSLKPGQVSDPVRVSSGFYLFRLESLTTRPFDEVSSDIFQEIRQGHFNEWLEATRKAVVVKIENEDFFNKAVANK